MKKNLVRTSVFHRAHPHLLLKKTGEVLGVFETQFIGDFVDLFRVTTFTEQKLGKFGLVLIHKKHFKPKIGLILF